MCRHDHGVAVDYFAMGVIAYECMLGRVTFNIYIYIYIYIYNTYIEALSGEVKERNKGSNIISASTN